MPRMCAAGIQMTAKSPHDFVDSKPCQCAVRTRHEDRAIGVQLRVLCNQHLKLLRGFLAQRTRSLLIPFTVELYAWRGAEVKMTAAKFDNLLDTSACVVKE